MKPEYDFSTGERGRFFRANAKLHLPDRDLSQPWAGPDEEPAAEFFGEEDPVRLADVWPGLWPVLKEWKLDVPDRPRDLVRCDRILVGGEECGCILHTSNIYLRRLGDGRRELHKVLDVLSAPRLYRRLKAVDEEFQPKLSIEQSKAEVAPWTANLLSEISKSILEYKPRPTRRTTAGGGPSTADRSRSSAGGCG